MKIQSNILKLIVGLSVILIVIIAVIVGRTASPVKNNNSQEIFADSPNVRSENNIQTIELFAKNGFSPMFTVAKANQSTILKVKTSNTYDCSSTLYIPQLNYRSVLPTTGEVSVNIPPQSVGTVLNGECSGGIYSFSVRFG